MTKMSVGKYKRGLSELQKWKVINSTLMWFKFRDMKGYQLRFGINVKIEYIVIKFHDHPISFYSYCYTDKKIHKYFHISPYPYLKTLIPKISIKNRFLKYNYK